MRKIFAVLVFTVMINSSGLVEAGVIDQAQENYDNCWLVICDQWDFAQTFTAGISGQLESIDLLLADIFDWNATPPSKANYPITISIVDVINFVPNGPVLGQAYVDNFESGFTNVNFLLESIYLTAGNQYGIMLSSEDLLAYDTPSTQWVSTIEDVYAGGSLWIRKPDTGWIQTVVPPNENLPVETFYDKDATFRTNMVPEPITAVLMGLGIVLLHRKSKL